MMMAAIQLFVLMGVFSVIESCWPSSRAHKWWRRPLLVDLCGWMVHPLSIGLGIAVAAASADGLAAMLSRGRLWLWILTLRMSVGGWSVWIQIGVAFLIWDFLSYWMHRAYHRFPLLWAFHVVHHTSEELDWLSTSRLHPISQTADTALVGFLLLLAGFPVTAILAANVIIGAAALLVHANVPWTFGFFQQVLVSPVFHQWHHARAEGEPEHRIGNFGAVLSVWDRLFGTWFLPALKRPERFGAEDAAAPTLLGMALHPFRVWGRFIARCTSNQTRQHDDHPGISR